MGSNTSRSNVLPFGSKASPKTEAGMTNHNSGSGAGEWWKTWGSLIVFILSIVVYLVLFSNTYGTLTTRVSMLETSQSTMKSDLTTSINTVKTDLTASMNNNNVFLTNSINSVKTDLRTDMGGIQATLNQLLLRR